MINYLIDSHQVGYELFLPEMSVFAYDKETKDSNLTESEFKDAVALVFRDAVITFMQESDLFRIDIPIDIFQDTQRYEIIPPDGYMVNRVVNIRSGKAKVPKHTLSVDEIFLNCCPDCDIVSAFWVNVSLIPMRHHGICKFDGRFLERYFDAILAKMKQNFVGQVGRNWRFLGAELGWRREYIKYRNRAIREALNQGNVATIRVRGLSEYE